MPRVRTNEPKASYASPVKTTSIPLNDDKAEKAKRLQSRKELAHKQTDSLRAAASPARKRKSLGGDAPATPDQGVDDGYGVKGDAVTPMKRVPILANFEEWMKMATDNKINATNSWNFALIDYFHDMSLLREGDGVNFQKASCTLDGCVKIYTSRVDSVATETGKLLSGLADSGSKKRRGGGPEDGEEGEDEDDEDDGEGGKKKNKKKAQRSAEATLAATFEQLRLKKMELEFSVDPLFKKAAADFDEGGAKGLLMNHLAIDGNGRIVFDSSDDVQERDTEDSRRDSLMEEDREAKEVKEETTSEPDAGPVDIAALGARFFPNLDRLDEQDVCPSLKGFELGSGNNVLNLPFLKAPDNWRDEHANSVVGGQQSDPTVAGAPFQDDGPLFGMDDDDDAEGAGFDLPPETGFGEGGEAWARDAALEPQLRVYDSQGRAETHDVEGEEVGTFDTNSNSYGITLHHKVSENDHENILNYFDTALRKNWAGPEHWKIARIKEAAKPQTEKRVRKEKEPFEIDFDSPMSAELATALYTNASSKSTISLPRNQWRSKTRNLLPDDKHFNSKDLLKLFLKPKAKLGSRTSGRSTRQLLTQPEEIDEAYWASHGEGAPQKDHQPHPMDDDAVQGDYDANFFQDDALPLPGLQDEDDTFADAREQFSPALDNAGNATGPDGAGIGSVAAGAPTEGGAFGLNLVTQSRRLRPEYVQYARVAKKVDVRRLKENMWHGIGFEERQDPPATPARPLLPTLSKDAGDQSVLKFTDIMNNLQHVYPRQQMQDISTSYGFICLLHLANEKGLVIENCKDWTDLSVRKDFHATDLDTAA